MGIERFDAEESMDLIVGFLVEHYEDGEGWEFFQSSTGCPISAETFFSPDICLPIFVNRVTQLEHKLGFLEPKMGFKNIDNPKATTGLSAVAIEPQTTAVGYEFLTFVIEECLGFGREVMVDMDKIIRDFDEYREMEIKNT